MQGRVGYPPEAFSTREESDRKMDRPTRKREDNAVAPMLYTALKLSRDLESDVLERPETPTDAGAAEEVPSCVKPWTRRSSGDARGHAGARTPYRSRPYRHARRARFVRYRTDSRRLFW